METETGRPGGGGPGTNDAHSGTWWSGLVLHQSILSGLDVYTLGGVGNWGCPCLSPSGKEDRKGLTAPALEWTPQGL